MTPERLSAILCKVQEKYCKQRLTPSMVKSYYSDISAVIKGLHKTEHFLNVSVDISSKVIVVIGEEDVQYLSLLPYLDNRLMDNNEIFIVYMLIGSKAYPQCAITFRDTYNNTDTSDLGFKASICPIEPLGIYYPTQNEFKKWRYE